ncbi:MAG: UDP-N-acetylmuramoyl-L-alanyl-D-glutamate--2,6-diaminopimelate ligase, partial [Oricola sp.]|nr:UDP-N-acetylmuramoyl-L-alanyl-D-glutamate--2,6-diaminopimelate ligase [Oricola sp.]
MRLQDLDGLSFANAATSPAEFEFSGVTADSRKVARGDLFVALSGSKVDGAAYAQSAEDAGAVAVLCVSDADIGVLSVPVIRSEDPRRALALIAAKLYAPQPETVVAVTGTAGKTSVAAFTRQIYADAGQNAASLGTTGVNSPKLTIADSLTTPDPVMLHTILRDLARLGTTHVAMEASSHGLDQRRLDGVKLSAGGFTNLGRDHMDYHPAVDDYFAAKMRLFDTLLEKGQPAVIFADDTYSGRAIEKAAQAGLDVLTVGRKGDFISLKRVEHERYRQ